MIFGKDEQNGYFSRKLPILECIIGIRHDSAMREHIFLPTQPESVANGDNPMKTENIAKTIANLIALLSVAVGGVFRAVSTAATACARSAARAFVVLALCVSAPAAFACENVYEREFNNKLECAIGYGDKNEVENLLKNRKDGDDINFNGHFGTPLHLAFLAKQTDALKLLLEHGADVTVRDRGGHTTLAHAERFLAMNPDDPGYAEVVNLLKQHIANEIKSLALQNTKEANDYVEHFDAKVKVVADDEPAALPQPDRTEPQPDRAKPKASYGGVIYSAAFIVADSHLPSWVDTQTFAFNEGSQFVTGQSLSVPLDNFTFAATRVQVNNLTDYEFAVKWEMEF